MLDPGDEIRAAFVEAYPPYVAGCLSRRGIDMDPVVADAVVEGAAVLDGLLTTLARTPPEEQRQSPLELFRESLRPVSRALDTLGVDPPTGRRGASPVPVWDHHGLSPASPGSLGARAHEAHLRWGVMKAAALGATPEPQPVERPVVVVLSPDVDAIRPVVTGAGYSVETVSGDRRPVVVLIDAALDGFDEEIRTAIESGARVIAFGDGIDDIREAGLRAVGVWKIASRDDVMHRLGTLIPLLG